MLVLEEPCPPLPIKVEIKTKKRHPRFAMTEGMAGTFRRMESSYQLQKSVFSHPRRSGPTLLHPGLEGIDFKRTSKTEPRWQVAEESRRKGAS